jgi:hypothetical protein
MNLTAEMCRAARLGGQRMVRNVSLMPGCQPDAISVIFAAIWLQCYNPMILTPLSPLDLTVLVQSKSTTVLLLLHGIHQSWRDRATIACRLN